MKQDTEAGAEKRQRQHEEEEVSEGRKKAGCQKAAHHQQLTLMQSLKGHCVTTRLVDARRRTLLSMLQLISLG